ncbi:hypothetical protein [Natronobiforma cellulositropha]|uniref:hypothetical protein n=1 Tax=Natronobiforma cellulositropha TaxID=1679076 RepID=UPI0021D583C1|nr:hypothetical protein [Natronobiforma cellulositropha]
MVRTLAALVFGVVLAAFGLVGLFSARAIVEKQRAEGLSTFADGTVDDRTRVLVTRAMAGAFVLVGVLLAGYGLGAF